MKNLALLGNLLMNFFIFENVNLELLIRYLVRVSVVIFVLGMIFIICIAQINKFFKWFKRNWDGEDSSHISERVPFAKPENALMETTYDDIELSARKMALHELKME